MALLEAPLGRPVRAALHCLLATAAGLSRASAPTSADERSGSRHRHRRRRRGHGDGPRPARRPTRSRCSTAPSLAAPRPTAMRASSPSSTNLLPLAGPSTLKRVPQMLMDRNGPLTVRLPAQPAVAAALDGALRAGRLRRPRGEEGRRFVRGPDGRGQIAWKAEIQASGLG